MLVETTTNFNDKDKAEDSLAGTKTVPGFLLGYLRPRPNQTFDVVTLFDCFDNDTPTLRRQKPVLSLTISTEAITEAMLFDSII